LRSKKRGLENRKKRTGKDGERKYKLEQGHADLKKCKDNRQPVVSQFGATGLKQVRETGGTNQSKKKREKKTRLPVVTNSRTLLLRGGDRTKRYFKRYSPFCELKPIEKKKKDPQGRVAPKHKYKQQKKGLKQSAELTTKDG